MSRHRTARSESALADKLGALNQARELGEGRLDDRALQDVYDVLERASNRRSLSSEHTVVGFFGATGSGKSSLFNAVVGSEVARVAVTRPTTSKPLAMVWKESGSAELLDWLCVEERRRGAPTQYLAEEGDGLILLDLPDLDSIQRENRAIVEKLAGQVDVLVWVVDPQKYADAAIHNDFIAPFSAHSAVTLVVLNQVDKLSDSEQAQVLESLAGILAHDGLGKVPVLPVSALTGLGVKELRKRIHDVVKDKQTQSARLAADVRVAAQELTDACGATLDDAAGVHQEDRRALTAGLSTAMHVDTVIDAVAASYRLESTRRTGWPVTRWISRFRKDPLRRLGLRRDDAPEVNRTSLPTPGVAEAAKLDSSVRTFSETVSQGAPDPWKASIKRAGRTHQTELPGALDLAIARADLKANSRAWWWPVFSVIQWLALLVAVGGLVWLGVLAALGYFQMPVPAAPKVEGWPVPTLMVIGGVVLGIFLAVTSKFVATAGARGRASSARRRLREGVADTAQELVIGPVEAEIERYKDFKHALNVARY